MKINWDKERGIYKWILRILWFGMFLGFVISTIYLIVVGNSDLPTFEDLENPKYDLASLIYDQKGQTFGKYYIENREQISYDSINPVVLNALLATEDERYFSHAGIDLRALFRVAIKTVFLRQESSGGGSTISQQLSKLLFKRNSLRGKSSTGKALALLKIKVSEWMTAVKLEKAYTKEEIIAMYLNKFEFINGAHGLVAAAEIYFNKEQKDLTASEAAVLVGMLKNPSLYNPKRFPERSKGRRNVVLDQMYKADLINKEKRDTLKASPIDLTGFNRSTQSEGYAPYFRAELTKWLKDLFEQPQYRKPDGSKYNIYTDGLKIHTTLDLDYQKHAEAAVLEHMEWNQQRYWNVWRGMNPLRYEADSLQLILRQQSVDRRVHYSDRYQNLFNRSFSETQDKVREEHGFEITEPGIRILVTSDTLSKSVQALANETLRKNYGSLVKSDEWDLVKDNWKSFRKEYKEEFDRKIEMTVFDYNEDYESVKTMSPLDSVKYHMRHFQAGMVAMSPHSGHIKAWVGGVNHKYFKFDHVTNRRQVGSTIKPFVYATAISIQGLSPCQEFADIQYTIAPGDANFDLVDTEWSPQNADENFTGNMYNLYQGLLYSKNSITCRLVKELGSVDVIRSLLHNAGIDKDERYSSGRLVVPRLPSIALGSMDLSLMEMCGAYTIFPNNGTYTQPVFVDYIEDKHGKVIYRNAPARKKALNPLYNSVMVDMLRNNTGGRYGFGVQSENGGKTGTTNDYADAWFMGITPELVFGTWVGGDEKWVRFYTLDDGQGFVTARPIFKKFLDRIEADSTLSYNPKAEFIDPPQGYTALVNCDKYKQVLPEDELTQTLEKKMLSDEFDEEEFGDEFDEEFEDEFEEESAEPDTIGINIRKPLINRRI